MGWGGKDAQGGVGEDGVGVERMPKEMRAHAVLCPNTGEVSNPSLW